jgi:hypothetical protein
MLGLFLRGILLNVRGVTLTNGFRHVDPPCEQSQRARGALSTFFGDSSYSSVLSADTEVSNYSELLRRGLGSVARRHYKNGTLAYLQP